MVTQGQMSWTNFANWAKGNIIVCATHGPMGNSLAATSGFHFCDIEMSL